MTADQVLELMIPDRLETPNRNRGAHWSRRHTEAKLWEWRVLVAMRRAGVSDNGWIVIEGTDPVQNRAGKWFTRDRRRKERRAVEIIRHIRTHREQIRDDDNLAYTVKPVLDALTRIGLIVDDSRKWIDLAPVLQCVSPDRAMTVIRIRRLEP